MATFACVNLPPQFITPPPSTSTQHNNDSDCGSSTGTNEGGMKAHEASDEGSTSSSQPTPPEYPSPPPPSNSPPESMASLQAELPNDTGGKSADVNLHPNPNLTPKVNAWMAQYGFHPVPVEAAALPTNPHSILFVHVNDGETLQFLRKSDHEVVGSPGTARMVGEYGMTNHPLPIHLRPDQQCHQFVDEEGNLRHVVLSVASPDNGSQNPRELNVPQLVGPQQLMHAMGIPNQRPRGGGRGRGRGYQRGGYGGRGNHHHQNGNGNHRGGHKYNNNNNGNHHNNRHEFQNGMNVQEIVPTVNLQNIPNELFGNVDMMQPPPPVQLSLLGEPNVPPIAEMAMGMNNNQSMAVPPPPGFPMLPPPPQEEMAMVPMNGQGLLQDPMMPSTSMGVQPMYPPNGIVVNGVSNFNNNHWYTNQSMEEAEALRELLSKGVTRASAANSFPTEVEVYWKPINIIEWQIHTPNGLFPAVTAAEIAYAAVVFDKFGKQLYTLSLEPNPKEEKSLFSVTQLHPNTMYDVHIKASIPDRGIFGDPSEMFRIFTAPGRPDAPAEAHVSDRGADFLVLVWAQANNNGVFVSLYHVYIYESEDGDGRLISVNKPEAIIGNLKPQTCYKISVSAINMLGESLTTFNMDAFTRAVRAPDVPKNFHVFALSHRSIRLSWETNPNCYFWVEVIEGTKNKSFMLRERFSGNNTILNELNVDTDYKVRLICRNEFGEASTDWVATRTQPFRKVELFPKTKNGEVKNQQLTNYDRPPTTPFFLRNVDDCPEMGWKSFGPDQRGNTYVIEAATYEAPETFLQLYRGSATSLIVVDETMHYIRVYAIHRKGYRSNTTDKVVIPRDYTRLRPDRVTDVTIALTPQGNVVVEWKELERENMKLPRTAIIRYYVKQADKVDSAVRCTSEPRLVYENVPGETTLSFCVRAGVSFHDALVHGDWSAPVTITTPRSLPPAVIDIKYTLQGSLLSWNCLDQSADLKFAVEVIEESAKPRHIMKVLTAERNVVIHGVELGMFYKAILTSYTNVGCTPNESVYKFSLPAQKPSAPTDGSVISTCLNKAVVIWGASESNGSAITGYTVKLMRYGKSVRDSFVEVSDATVYRATMKELKPNTVYDVMIAAKNAVGESDPITIAVKTTALAPTTPELRCEPEHFLLKLSWDHITSSPSISYKIIRINNTGQQVSVYEGDNNNVRVQRLSEDTEYSFRIRVLDKETGANTWSETFTFRTLIAPPPAAKLPLTTTQIAGQRSLYNVEWPDYFKSKRKDNEFFRLQVADATNRDAKWEVVYEGSTPRFELSTKKWPGALHIRVMCVRSEEKRELKGAPSEVGYIGNTPVTDAPVEEEVNDRSERARRFLLRNSTFVSYVVGFLILIGIAVNFSEFFFMWLTGQNPNDRRPSTR